MVRDMSRRLKNSETTFSSATIIPLVESYAIEQLGGEPTNPNPEWIPNLFIEVGFAYDTILSILQGLFVNDIAPFNGRNRNFVGWQMVYVCEKWYLECVRSNQRLFGTEENAAEISQILEMLRQSGLNGKYAVRATELQRKIERSYS